MWELETFTYESLPGNLENLYLATSRTLWEPRKPAQTLRTLAIFRTLGTCTWEPSDFLLGNLGNWEPLLGNLGNLWEPLLGKLEMKTLRNFTWEPLLGNLGNIGGNRFGKARVCSEICTMPWLKTPKLLLLGKKERKKKIEKETKKGKGKRKRK